MLPACLFDKCYHISVVQRKKLHRLACLYFVSVHEEANGKSDVKTSKVTLSTFKDDFNSGGLPFLFMLVGLLLVLPRVLIRALHVFQSEWGFNKQDSGCFLIIFFFVLFS